MNRRQIQTLYLRHRDKQGLLDWDAVMAERAALRAKENEASDPFAGHRELRRVQGWAEHLIDREISEMRAKNG